MYRAFQGENMSQSFSGTIPVQLTVGGGAAVAAAQPTTSAVAVIAPDSEMELGEAVTIDQDWSKRKGYDASFLDVSIPLPQLSTAQQANTAELLPQFRKGKQKYILNYYHYSVAMNKKRRSAWFSAGM